MSLVVCIASEALFVLGLDITSTNMDYNAGRGPSGFRGREIPFSQLRTHGRSIEATWIQRAVDFHYVSCGLDVSSLCVTPGPRGNANESI